MVWTTHLGMAVWVVLFAVALFGSRSVYAPVQTLSAFCGLLALALGWVGLRQAWDAAQHHRWRPITIAGVEHHPLKLAARITPPAVVVLVALGLLYPAFIGDPPLSHDHPVHMYKAWHLWEEGILEGRLRGWSHYWFAGYPADEFYPIGASLWVAGFRVLTLGLLSWGTTYGIAFTAAITLTAYGVYALGERHLGAAAGVIGALLWLLDPGGFREGGWFFTVNFAVWPQILAMGCALLTFARLDDVITRGRPWDYAIAAGLCGLGLLSHPMNLILYVVGVPIYLLARATLNTSIDKLAKEVTATVGVCALGGALASFWFVPMLARSGDWTNGIGAPWQPLVTTAEGLLAGDVFMEAWPFIVFLGLLGAAIGVVMRNWMALFLAVFGLFLLYIASSTAYDDWNLFALSESFSSISYQRFTIAIKVCFYLLAGFAVARICVLVHAARPTSQHLGHTTRAPVSWRSVALTLVVAALLAPFVGATWQAFTTNYLFGVGELRTADDIQYWSDYEDFLAWSAEQRENSSDFYRIAYALRWHDHTMMGAPIVNNTPVYKIGYTPAKLFKPTPTQSSDAYYEALSVKFVVTRGRETFARSPNLKLFKRFGTINVYRFALYQPERYTLSGAGTVEVLEFGAERIRLRLQGTDPDTRLKIHVAHYARWSAAMNGQSVDIETAPVAPSEESAIFMEVPVEDGELEFDYVMLKADWLGSLLSLLGLAILGVLLLAQRHPPTAALFRAALRPKALGLVRAMPWLIMVAILAVASLLIARWSQSEPRASRSIVYDLGQATMEHGAELCTNERGQRWSCSELLWNYKQGPTRGDFVPCVWSTNVVDAPTTITFDQVRLGEGIEGVYRSILQGAHPNDSKAPQVTSSATLTLLLDDVPIEMSEESTNSKWRQLRANTSARAGERVDLTLQITPSLSDTGDKVPQRHCFDLRVRD